MKIYALLLLTLLPCHAIFAECDLTQFRWECQIRMYIKPTPYATSLVYCGDTYGYVTRRQFDLISRYQNDDINMGLNIDNEYADSPCIPIRR